MDILMMIQNSETPELFAVIALLPWAGVALMQMLSLVTREVLDDNFGVRKGAALRWNRQNLELAGTVNGAVLEYRAHRPAQARVKGHTVVEDEAA